MHKQTRRICPRILLALCLLFSLCFVPSTGGCRAPAASAETDPRTEASEIPPLRDYLRECLIAEEPSIDLTAHGSSSDEVANTLARLLAEEPDLFYVGREYTLTYASGAAAGCPSALIPSYRYTGAALADAREDFTRRISEYVAPVSDAAPLVRVAYLHDRMILEFSYDETVQVSDAYSLLVGGQGVCQAYSLLFTALCRAAGVPAACVTCFSHTHAWNQVELGGAWYHVDLTWDETALPYAGRVPHPYFLLTDAELAEKRMSDDPTWEGVSWDAPHRAVGESLLSLGFTDSFGAMASVDGVTLYYTARHCVYALDTTTGEVRELYRVSDPPTETPLMTLAVSEGVIYCNLPRAILTITPAARVSDGGCEETLTFSHPLTESGQIYCGVSLSPAGRLLFSTLCLA